MTNHEANKPEFKVSPDGKQVAYIVVDPTHESIWVARSDGTLAHRLTPWYPSGEGETAAHIHLDGWSADGFELVYKQVFAYLHARNQCYIANVPTGTIRTVGDKGSMGAIDWNPKRADELLYIPATSPVYLLNVRTGNRVEIKGEVPGLRYEHLDVLGFTPDGDALYLVRWEQGRVVTVGRTGQILWHIHVTAPLGALEWSPNGQQLLLGIWDQDRRVTDIYVITAESRNWRRVVSRQAFGEPDDSYDIYLGTWSPDGQWFTVFKTERGGSHEIYICHVETGELWHVLTMDLAIYNCVWLP
ncbi:MAG: hypothetical protein KKA73_25395 [Chloroflexi bacterium]|nr:hypothetical protein [Chloroflexota bacterium]